MSMYCLGVRAASLIINYLCVLVVPVIEIFAHKLSVSDCVCSSPQPTSKRKGRGKRARHASNGDAVPSSGSAQGTGVKRIKLLLDITVDKNGSQIVDVQASPEVHPVNSYMRRTTKGPGYVLMLLNLPSSVLLYIVSKFRQWSSDLAALENKACSDEIRIKKSPKRRISKPNYRKIIPFFPFNLLGFSNYSAFQMPTLTCSSSSTERSTLELTTEDVNNLNVSNVSTHENGKTRCKRRRDSSTHEDCSALSSLSSDSENDFSFFEAPEAIANVPVEENKIHQNGHDEVDSDESAGAVVITKSSLYTSSEQQGESSSPPESPEMKSADGNTTGTSIVTKSSWYTSSEHQGDPTSSPESPEMRSADGSTTGNSHNVTKSPLYTSSENQGDLTSSPPETREMRSTDWKKAGPAAEFGAKSFLNTSNDHQGDPTSSTPETEEMRSADWTTEGADNDTNSFLYNSSEYQGDPTSPPETRDMRNAEENQTGLDFN